MKALITASLILIVCGTARPSLAQSADDPVPIEKAPFHVPVFSNDFVTLLNIQIPPGHNTGFHTHYADSVSVNVAPATRTTQFLGKSEITTTTTDNDGLPGRVSFNDVTHEGAYTHKVTITGPTPFHIIAFVLKARGSDTANVSDRAGVAGFTQIMDNARVRAWRVILNPGESTGQISQTAPGLRIYVRGGVIAEVVPGSADRGMAADDADFIWQNAGQTRAVRNTGATRVEFVEFELK